MSEIVQDVTAPAMIHAIEANQFEFWSLSRYIPGCEGHYDAEMLWTISDVYVPGQNLVLRALLPPGQVDDAIETAIARCRSRGVPMLWFVGPASRPVNLGAALLAHGFTHQQQQPGMALDLQLLREEVPAIPGFTVELVSDGDALKKWIDTAILGFSITGFIVDVVSDYWGSIGFGEDLPVHHFIGIYNGEPVATASLMLAAGVAGIYNVSTIPGHRRRGIGALITWAALREARAQGYRIAILHATKMGLNIYRQLGFQEYCTIGHYLWSGESNSAPA